MRPAPTLAAFLLAAPACAEPFTFVALGDVPYGDPAEVYPPFERLIETINGVDPDLVIHVGDTKSGGTVCSDEILADQRAYLDDFDAPTIYTPGDNEWTDCHREAAGGFDPLERLAHIRATYFDDPATSFGAETVALEHQGAAGYPENTRLDHEGITFVAAHVVGSNNNFEPRALSAVEEFLARDAASTDWLREGFAAASASDAIVVAIHANIFDSGFCPPWNCEVWVGHSGFRGFGLALQEEAAAFGKPVLLVYGDSHVFRQSRPFPNRAPNVLALEVPGAEQMHAVQVGVDTDLPGVFTVELLRNPALDG